MSKLRLGRNSGGKCLYCPASPDSNISSDHPNAKAWCLTDFIHRSSIGHRFFFGSHGVPSGFSSSAISCFLRSHTAGAVRDLSRTDARCSHVQFGPRNPWRNSRCHAGFRTVDRPVHCHWVSLSPLWRHHRIPDRYWSPHDGTWYRQFFGRGCLGNSLLGGQRIVFYSLWGTFHL